MNGPTNLARLVLVRLGNYATLMAVVALAWQAAIATFAIPPYLLPPPVAAAKAMADNFAAIGYATSYTVSCTIVGMAISVLVAIALALAFLLSDPLGQALMPLIVVIRTVPMIAVAPLIVVILGRGRTNSIAMVAMLTFFQIMLTTRKGLIAPPRNVLEMLHTCGAGFWDTLTKVRVPFAVPYIFTGIRIAANSALLCAMFAEWLSGAPGLGRLILDSYSTENFSLMWATILVSTSIAYFFFTATLVVERMVLDRLK